MLNTASVRDCDLSTVPTSNTDLRGGYAWTPSGTQLAWLYVVIGGVLLGDWAMAKYIEAVEMHDAATRAAIMDEILAYNREDLEATWAVLQWLNQIAMV